MIEHLKLSVSGVLLGVSEAITHHEALKVGDVSARFVICAVADGVIELFRKLRDKHPGVGFPR